MSEPNHYVVEKFNNAMRASSRKQRPPAVPSDPIDEDGKILVDFVEKARQKGVYVLSHFRNCALRISVALSSLANSQLHLRSPSIGGGPC
jgi:hypothetical protein